MAGVKIEQGTLTHRKTLRLKGLLGIGVAQAVGHLTMLWVWAASSTKDGSLAGMTPTEIAEVSGWAGEPADFLAAMIDAGYIDEAPGGFRLHDWAENTGQIEAEARREAARERQRRFKERKRAEKAAEAARAEASKVPAPQQKPLVVAPQPPQRTEPRTDPELARAGQFYLNNIKPKETRGPLSRLTLKGFRVLCGVFLRGCYAAATLIYWRLYMCSRLRCSLARNLSAAAIKALNSG